MRKSLLIIGGVAVSSLSAWVNGQVRPNIIMILVDDLGYGDLSCQEGTRDVQTPHIDKLLNEGIRFTNFHANSPVSSPSRAALLTGRYPDMVGVPGVIRPQKEDSWGYFSEQAITLPQMLKTVGYHTSIIGKWHLGFEAPNIPTERGFDYFHGFLADMMDDYYTHRRFGNNYMYENRTEIDPQGHATELFTDWAIEYIERQKDDDSPFFMYLAYNAPHIPIQPPKQWLDRVRNRLPHLSLKRAQLVALIEHLDYQIGRVYQTLERENLLENTLILFASDNGGQAEVEANNGLFRGAKQDMYEGGIRVAGGCFWKGKIQPAVLDNFVMLSDIFPTLCELTGVEILHEIDGKSFLPLLKGNQMDTDNRIAFWVRREGNFKYGGLAYYAARYGKYKILQNTPWESIQFFDLEKDPQENEAIQDKNMEPFKYLFKGMIEHIRQSGMVPWQNVKYK